MSFAVLGRSEGNYADCPAVIRNAIGFMQAKA